MNRSCGQESRRKERRRHRLPCLGLAFPLPALSQAQPGTPGPQVWGKASPVCSAQLLGERIRGLFSSLGGCTGVWATQKRSSRVARQVPAAGRKIFLDQHEEGRHCSPRYFSLSNCIQNGWRFAGVAPSKESAQPASPPHSAHRRVNPPDTHSFLFPSLISTAWCSQVLSVSRRPYKKMSERCSLLQP